LGEIPQPIRAKTRRFAAKLKPQPPDQLQEVQVLRNSVVLLIATLSLVALSGASSSIPEGHLRLYHTHTGERLDIVYRHGAAYIPEALAKLDHFLRDHRTGEVHHFDPRLFDVLSDATRAVGRADAEIHIICGYRAPKSNEYLRTHTSGVAKNSLHMQAEAIDIRLPGTRTSKFRDAALALGRGGVGYYPASDFIHVDVGRVRRW
jgi:uncharacterized protein YcbK (DUF882 family)